MTLPAFPPGAEWHARAECAGVTGFTEYPHEIRLGYCEPCPVRQPCERADIWPFWGCKPEVNDKTARHLAAKANR